MKEKKNGKFTNNNLPNTTILLLGTCICFVCFFFCSLFLLLMMAYLFYTSRTILKCFKSHCCYTLQQNFISNKSFNPKKTIPLSYSTLWLELHDTNESTHCERRNKIEKH